MGKDGKTICATMALTVLMSGTGLFAVGCGEAGEKVSTAQEFIETIQTDPHTNIRLTENLDFSGIEWTPLEYHGILNGDGHTISNIEISETSGDYVGIFSHGKFSIENLKIKGMVVNYYGDGQCVGGLAGIWGERYNRRDRYTKYILQGYLKNVEIEGEINAMGATCVGGMFGEMQYGRATYNDTSKSIENVRVDVDVVGGEEVGGAIGRVCLKEEGFAYDLQDTDRQAMVANLDNYGSVQAIKGTAGGVAGNSVTPTIYSSCNNFGTMTGKTVLGGIVGQAENTCFESCKNEGKVSTGTGASNEGIVGGIVGQQIGGQLTGCINRAEVYSYLSVCGGIVGMLSGEGGLSGISSSGSGTQVIDCTNFGKIYGEETVGGSIGGIVGRVVGKNNLINICKNEGEIRGYDGLGGIVGEIFGTWTGEIYAVGEALLIQDCENAGDIYSTTAYSNGIYGRNLAAEAVEQINNKNTGTKYVDGLLIDE